jgi:hypothetical protein
VTAPTQLLEPDELTLSKLGHKARNEKLVAKLTASDVSLSLVRQIDLHFRAYAQPNAEQLFAALDGRGYTSIVMDIVELKDGTEAWNVEAQISDSIEAVTKDDFAFGLVDLAASFDTIFEGWGVSL